MAIGFLQAAEANTGVVRGGEHGLFTRLTIATTEPVEDLQISAKAPGRHGLMVEPAIAVLDASLMFDRLSAGRVLGLREDDTGLELALNCDCTIEIRTENEDLIVIDIFDDTAKAALPAVQLPVLPVASGVLPEPWEIGLPQGASTPPFALDFSVVDRLSKHIASQITENAHVKGFAELTPDPNDVATSEPYAREAALSQEHAETSQRSCTWLDAVWNVIATMPDHGTGSVEESAYGRETESWTMSDDVAETMDIWIATYLAHGMIEEAKDAIFAADGATEKQTGLLQLLAIIDGSKRSGHSALSECNPLSQLLVAQDGKENTTNEMQLTMLQTFGALPDGLQMALYPRLEWLLEDSAAALFPELRDHRLAELELAERKSFDDSATGTIPDPDHLAAISRELRGTDLESSSWQASFSSYLSHQRYFDAVEQLNSTNPLTDRARAIAVKDFVDHLLEHANSITFVQIALDVLPELSPKPTAQDLDRVAQRLRDEGFAEEALRIAVLGPAVTPGPASGVEPIPRTEEEPAISATIPVAEAERLTPVRQTVASAREQLENSSAVLQSLTEQFAN